jgi:hypothetical protein
MRWSTHSLLRTALQLDAAASGGMGLLLAAAAGPLAGPLGLPEPLLRGAGLVLAPYAAVVAAVGARAAVPRPAAWAVVAANALWVGASAVLLARLARGPDGPTPLGYALVVLQALTVLAFAELQWVGLRRAARPAAPAGAAA